MFLNKVSFDAFKQKFSEKVQTIGSFCGRKVEVLKSSATPFLAQIQSAANTGLNTLSQAAQKAKKAFSATKEFISTNISNVVAKVFKRKQAEEAPAAPAPVAAGAAAEEAPAAPAPVVAPAPRRSGRAVKPVVRFQPRA
jgi:hypothetical protein